MRLLQHLPWFASLLVQLVQAQNSGLPNSFPHAYPGQPSGDLSPAWQDYFEVDNTQLPNITFPLPRSFAGSIPVDRPGHPNNTLFFWGFEKSSGSLTVESSSDPWLIWLQGGPGSSSLAGMIYENGPFRLQSDFSMRENSHSFDRLVDSIWVDQPVGTGYSTSDSTGYVADDDQMADDFVLFLANLVKVFPSLATRPLFLAGESYAGRWIPYIAKALFSAPNPPVNLAKLVMGNPTIGSFSAGGDSSVVSVIETFPHLVSYDPEVLQFFRKQRHLCGYDLNLTYPQQGGHFPTLARPSATDPNSPWFYEGSTPPWFYSMNFHFSKQLQFMTLVKAGKNIFIRDTLEKRYLGGASRVGLSKRDLEREAKREQFKRDLSLRTNDTIDPWYACNLLEELYAYAVNFTFPWNTGPGEAALNVYDAMDVLNPKPLDSVVSGETPPFYNDNRTRAAIHAPTSKDWTVSFPYPFGSTQQSDPSPDSQDFLDELAQNATEKGVDFVIYSGNNDMLLGHFGTEVAIQNTTFGGIQGFTQKPATPWFNDDGSFAGIVHQERGWTYALFQDAGHLVPSTKPAAAFTFLRDFILGDKATGLVSVASDGSTSVVGGRESSLTGVVLPPETAAVYYGSAVTQSTLTYPAATVAAWNSAVSSLNQLDSRVQSTQDSNSALSLKSGFGSLSTTFSVLAGTLIGVIFVFV